MNCVCEEIGYFNSGLAGALAHVEAGRIVSLVERCDACNVYSSDAEAEQALREKLEGKV